MLESAADDAGAKSNAIAVPTIIAAGKATMIADRRYRVYRPHNSALSVLIIRRTTKHDAGVYRCNLSGSSTRQKYLVLNVTGKSVSMCTALFILSNTLSSVFCRHDIISAVTFVSHGGSGFSYLQSIRLCTVQYKCKSYSL